MEKKWLENVVLVTGAANGIGKAIARGYAKQGANVFMVDIDRDGGKELEKELQDEGYQAQFLYGDVGKEEDVLNVIHVIKDKVGQLHFIINNAGVSKFKPIEELSFNEWSSIIHTNLSSVFLFSKYGSTLMSNGGAIVNISSTRALMSEEHSEAYAASKGGITALTHALAASLSKNNIRVNSISPGWIETGDYSQLRKIDHKQHFSKRVGRPEDIVRTCFFLTNSKNVFINGENIVIDGGMTRKMIYEH
ncbi:MULTISPECIES: SDR family oxidoreductase [Bacillaceae]|uniref:SDR family oxidoreductase n=1 Tax=Evansella alkalicola TaxID=745819 RepID=A0ABS6JZM9_9BACI|nr:MULTISPECIES: SDR family oxidoreductase [Bacillaceae]MBU9724052.1 SDR family oxidoreductase [Bacillus alkalicola]